MAQLERLTNEYQNMREANLHREELNAKLRADNATGKRGVRAASPQ